MKTNGLILFCAVGVLMMFGVSGYNWRTSIIKSGSFQAHCEQGLERVRFSSADSVFHTHSILNLSIDQPPNNLSLQSGDTAWLHLFHGDTIHGAVYRDPTMKAARFEKCDNDTTFTAIGIRSEIKSAKPIVKYHHLCEKSESAWYVEIESIVTLVRREGEVMSSLNGGLAIILETQDPEVYSQFTPEIIKCLVFTKNDSFELRNNSAIGPPNPICMQKEVFKPVPSQNCTHVHGAIKKNPATSPQKGSPKPNCMSEN